MQQWLATAPANIALIKYMGKQDHQNTPANGSLSYTLPNLQSTVTLEPYSGQKDIWEPLTLPGSPSLTLSPMAQQRFLKHFHFLKAHVGYDKFFIVRSVNNFPKNCGLASSASSFAALTQCALRAFTELTQKPMPSLHVQARLSQVGSGSSCRSFFKPWAIWQEDEVKAISLPYTTLHHQVIIISRAEKAVSSSHAHQRVTTSPLYARRAQRANERLDALLNALNSENWSKAYEICTAEFHDMHKLFTTSSQPFSYMTPTTDILLQKIADLWHTHGDGPLVTMDAGPNIHLLYRPDQKALMHTFTQTHLTGQFDVL
ncbi:MAG: diphosphomevalonate decarboxylase [Legionellaceae bacterium]|nr:diphosphomevalonate decarboxylase [Legionellaceae bacterium]HCA90282.1 diphosphomevalonate decarboxylase [Legionellales bacterium]|tara:strand:- start:2208 stop:3155 length:948 start_codon:yes stop_codon:yes gene_type:complete